MVYKMISISRTCVIFKKGWNLSDAQKRIYVLKNSRLEPAIFANIRKTNGYTKFHSNYCKFSNLGQNGLSWQGLHHTTCIYIQASRGTSRKMSPPDRLCKAMATLLSHSRPPCRQCALGYRTWVHGWSCEGYLCGSWRYAPANVPLW